MRLGIYIAEQLLDPCTNRKDVFGLEFREDLAEMSELRG